MKKFSYSHLLVFLIVLSLGSTLAQVNFANGKAYIRADRYGAIRYFTIDGGDTLQQLNRVSFIIGGNNNQVMDYNEDVEYIDSSVVVASPQKSDYEIRGLFNNTYNNYPPNFEVEQNLYAWNNQSFCIIRLVIKNNETVATPCIPGLDIIQYIDEFWEENSIYYDNTNHMLVQYKDHWVGVKMLSENAASGQFIEWYENYSADTLYYRLLQPGFTPDTLFTTPDGGVGVVGGASTTLQPGATRTVYFAIVTGTSQAEMLANLQLAGQRYAGLTDVESNTSNIPTEFSLGQNYPNPFNPSTSIQFNLPVSSFVTLKVYDLLGKEVSSLVNEELSAGVHSVNFNASNIPSGTYFYTIQANGSSITKKMMLLK